MDGVVEGYAPPTPPSSISTLADEEHINRLEKQMLRGNPDQSREFELMVDDIVGMGLTRDEAETALLKQRCMSVVEAVEWHFQQYDAADR